MHFEVACQKFPIFKGYTWLFTLYHIYVLDTNCACKDCAAKFSAKWQQMPGRSSGGSTLGWTSYIPTILSWKHHLLSVNAICTRRGFKLTNYSICKHLEQYKTMQIQIGTCNARPYIRPYDLRGPCMMMHDCAGHFRTVKNQTTLAHSSKTIQDLANQYRTMQIPKGRRAKPAVSQ